MNNTTTQSFPKELNSEYRATRTCFERNPEKLFGYKPPGEIDFATFKHFAPKATKELLNHFEDNMEAARKALRETNDESLQSQFVLKTNGQNLLLQRSLILVLH